MNLYTGESADDCFGGEVEEAVRSLLRRAATVVADDRGAILWSAQAIAPDRLPGDEARRARR